MDSYERDTQKSVDLGRPQRCYTRGEGVHSVAGRVAERGFEIYVAVPCDQNVCCHGWHDCCHVNYEHCIHGRRFCRHPYNCEVCGNDYGTVLFVYLHEKQSGLVVPRDEKNDC